MSYVIAIALGILIPLVLFLLAAVFVPLIMHLSDHIDKALDRRW